METVFEIENATLADVPQMATIVSLAWAKDPLWQAIMQDATDIGEREFIARWLAKDFSIPGTIGFKVIHKGAKKMVAWIRLGIPATLSPSQQTIKDTRAPYSEGMNEQLFTFLEASSQGQTYLKLGFDPEKDFIRQGTFVDPEFQQKGLGARLAKHLNVIADEKGARTWCASGPAIVKLMGDQGFVVQQEVRPKELRGAGFVLMMRDVGGGER